MKKNIFSFEEGKAVSLDLFNKNLEKILQDKQKIAFVKNLLISLLAANSLIFLGRYFSTHNE